MNTDLSLKTSYLVSVFSARLLFRRCGRGAGVGEIDACGGEFAVEGHVDLVLDGARAGDVWAIAFQFEI